MVKTLTTLLFLATVANATSQVERVETRVIDGIEVKDVKMKNRKTSASIYKMRLDNPHNRNIDLYKKKVESFNLLTKEQNVVIDTLNKTDSTEERKVLIEKMHKQQISADILMKEIAQLQKAIESTK